MLTKYIYANLPSNYYTKFLFCKQWMYNVGIYCFSFKQYEAYRDTQNKSGSYLFFHQFILAS